MAEKPKIVNMSDKKDAEAIYLMRTKMGTFIGTEQLDNEGSIMGFSNVYEVIALPDAQRGLALMFISLGDMMEFPEDDYVLIELSKGSPYAQRYKDETRVIKTPPSGIEIVKELPKGA